MRHRQGPERQRLSRTAALLLLPLAAGLTGASAPQEGATVTVTATDLRSAKGLVQACMTSAESQFPRCDNPAEVLGTTVSAAGKTVTLRFTGVKPGRYAIALLHDENGNGKADMALGFMPKEGFGFSRDARVRMGPPKFSEAAVDIGTADQHFSIRMRYLL
ncbi:DUF2141 domain-containing protein [Qipengyuania marisflavi]|uniref:DUF2141 domain-containing protein n=1 Tax=Qipengyuania marisflavi TaxID=2486356 RepID=UPI001FE9E0F5|nr:DUF2141 domain-containing protein [Qipengyuania marisflavi]